jgi:predicted NAD/FAD-binding protein
MTFFQRMTMTTRKNCITAMVVFALIYGCAKNQVTDMWSVLSSGLNNYVQALAVDRSGNLYAGGGSPRLAEWLRTVLLNGTAVRGALSATD